MPFLQVFEFAILSSRKLFICNFISQNSHKSYKSPFRQDERIYVCRNFLFPIIPLIPVQTFQTSMKRLLFFFLSVVFIPKFLVLISGCAQIISPTGGKRDS